MHAVASCSPTYMYDVRRSPASRRDDGRYIRLRPENADERRLNDNGGLLLGRNIAMLTLWWHQRSQKS